MTTKRKWRESLSNRPNFELTEINGRLRGTIGTNINIISTCSRIAQNSCSHLNILQDACLMDAPLHQLPPSEESCSQSAQNFLTASPWSLKKSHYNNLSESMCMPQSRPSQVPSIALRFCCRLEKTFSQSTPSSFIIDILGI